MALSFIYGAHIDRNGSLGRPGTSDGREGDIVLVGIRNFTPVALRRTSSPSSAGPIPDWT